MMIYRRFSLAMSSLGNDMNNRLHLAFLTVNQNLIAVRSFNMLE